MTKSTGPDVTDRDTAEEPRAEDAEQVEAPPAAQSSAAADEPPETRVRSGLGRRLPVAGGALVVAASLASAVYFYLQLQAERDVAEAKSAATAAACDYTRDLANFDFNNLDAYYAGVLDGATGEWKAQFDAQRERLREVYAQGQVTSQVTDAQCAIISGDEDTAEALVLVTEAISTSGGSPQTAQVAMTFSLDNVDGRWLVSKLSGPQLP